MEKFYRDLLHKAACGHLVQGLVHNMSGPLQILSMQIEIMRSTLPQAPVLPEKKEKFIEQQEKKLQQIEDQLLKLRKLLNIITEMVDETPTTLDLNQALEQLLLFWEGDLRFKHEITKEKRFSTEPLLIKVSPKAFFTGFTALFWWLVPYLVEKKGSLQLETTKDRDKAQVIISSEENLPEKDHFQELASDLLSSEGEISFLPKQIRIHFKLK